MRISDWSPDVCSSDLSDIVGRLQVSPTDWVDVLYRFRADKDDLSLRRSEVGLRVSTPLLRVTAEHLHLDSAAATSDLFNRREQIRVAASTKLSRHWSLFGSHRRDQIGRAHVRTTVTTAQLVCRLLIEITNSHSRNTNT